MSKKNVNICVVDIDDCDGDWPPSNAIETVDWFTRKLNLVPIEYRASANFDISHSEKYDSVYARISLYYCRPETDEETVEREKQEKYLEELRKERDLTLLAELQKKYGK
jgi:hypothetical protein